VGFKRSLKVNFQKLTTNDIRENQRINIINFPIPLGFLIGVIPLTLCGISYERVRSFSSPHSSQCVFPMWKVLTFTWGVSGILSSPRFFAYEYDDTIITNGIGNGSSSVIPETPSEIHPLSSHDKNDSYTFHYTSVCRKVSKETKQQLPTPLTLWKKVYHEMQMVLLLF